MLSYDIKILRTEKHLFLRKTVFLRTTDFYENIPAKLLNLNKD